MYSESSRGYPDISAQADDFVFILNGETRTMWGTSCSAPVRLSIPFPSSILLSTQLIVDVQTVAGVISLLNDYRLSSGKRPFGWLNPWLYSRGLAGLNDITSGSNPGCDCEGFFAVPGWDPVCLADTCIRSRHELTPSSIGYGSWDARLS
jgi:tripeptidyl-peptidase-1